MKDKKILFITFDLSGYYNAIKEELEKQFSVVEYYNIADLKKYKYKNFLQKIYAGIYKLLTKKKLKNYYKLQPIILATSNKHFDYTLVIRPDLFFDSQLSKLKNRSDSFIAYYHDSINNIPRKKDVIHFFDKVFSYEKKDVKDYSLEFISNFIYLNKDIKKSKPIYDAFTIMSKDYRFNTLEKLAVFLNNKNINYKFLVQSDKNHSSDLINFIKERKNNAQVLEFLKKSKILVDIHKYDIQDGLTFRVFESIFLEKKLITTNKNIKTYDFYNPNNIFVLEDISNINIPDSFFESKYEPLPEKIYNRYHYKSWINTILK